MSKEEYYSKIKKIIYRKFDELEVVKRNRGNNLYLRYKNEEYAQIRDVMCCCHQRCTYL